MAAAADMSTRVVLKIACEGLARMDLLSHSDPFVVISANHGGGWSEVCKRETTEKRRTRQRKKRKKTSEKDTVRKQASAANL